jgi:hypothetical protein
MGWFMVFNVTFNNISVIWWRSVLLVVETGVLEEKPPTCRKSLDKTLSHNVVSSTPRPDQDSHITTLVLIGTDCTGSCKSIRSWPQGLLYINMLQTNLVYYTCTFKNFLFYCIHNIMACFVFVFYLCFVFVSVCLFVVVFLYERGGGGEAVR